MNKKQLILLLIIVAIFVNAATFAYFTFHNANTILGTQTIPINLDITERDALSMNADTDGLHFDGVPQGSNAKKYITITNNRKKPVDVFFFLSGNITKYATVSTANITLQSGESHNITVFMDVGANETMAHYEGYPHVKYVKTR